MKKNIFCHICGNTDVFHWIKKNGYDIYRCSSCRLFFVFPIPKNLGFLYEKNYFQKTENEGSLGYVDYDRDKEPMREEFEEYLHYVGVLTEGRKVFDVGAATGYFLDIAKLMGWRTAGTEISKFAAKEAKSRGHSVYCEELPNVSLSEEFSLVTMWDVLEHVGNPREYLKAANTILTEGGYLMINTPDAGSYFAKILGKRWHLIVPPEHLYYYSRKNLKQLLFETGFEIVEEKSVGKKFTLAYIFGTLYRWQDFLVWKKASEFFDKVFWRKYSVPINLHDNMLIIARKKGKENKVF